MLTELRRRAAICSDLPRLLVLIVGSGHGVLRRRHAKSVGAGRIVGAGHVDNDGGLGVLLFGDGGEGAEELVGDVGEDGGAPGEDFVLGCRIVSRRRIERNLTGDPGPEKDPVL